MGNGSRVDYDKVAPRYDRRYQNEPFGEIDDLLCEQLSGVGDVLEVGCGSGHWLARMEAWGCEATGIDPSAGMLDMALRRGLAARLVRGRAEHLPWAAGAFDRVVCVHAHHHFDDLCAFARGALRVLRPGGELIAVGLDPSNGEDSWSVYDYFEGTLETDLARYPSRAILQQSLTAAGFEACRSFLAQHLSIDQPGSDFLASGLLDKDQTSHLTLLSDEAYQRGLARIRADMAAADGRGAALRLTADLRVYATVARRSS